MSGGADHFELEREAIRKERISYRGGNLDNQNILKFYDWVSTAFLFLGFGALILVFFTDVTLLQATCFFVIHYTIAPTDTDRSEAMLKGVAEDIGHIRANLTVIRKRQDATP